MPTVARLSIAPVKSLALQHPDEITLTEHGVSEDRRFYLVDADGRLIDGLTAGRMVQVAGLTNLEATVLRLTFPDGRVVEDEVRTTEPIVTDMYGRTVHGRVVDGPFAAALEPFTERPVRVVRTDMPGGCWSEHQATLVTDGSIAELARRLEVETLDARRFRMLIELSGGAAHEEDTWVGGRIAIGSAVLRISSPVPRCAMTTHDPATGLRDLDTLRAIRTYRGLRDGKHLDFGVWGEVEQPGRIRLGDEVRLLTAAEEARSA
jgi:uncharacterized protein